MHYVFATQVIIYRFVIPYQDWNLPLTQNFLIGLFSLQPDVYYFFLDIIHVSYVTYHPTVWLPSTKLISMPMLMKNMYVMNKGG